MGQCIGTDDVIDAQGVADLLGLAQSDGDFYVRLNNSTRLLSTADALDYVRSHWR